MVKVKELIAKFEQKPSANQGTSKTAKQHYKQGLAYSSQNKYDQAPKINYEDALVYNNEGIVLSARREKEEV